jgi:hypothetical protein
MIASLESPLALRTAIVAARVEEDLALLTPKIQAFYGEALAGIYLGGGYGRGEGGLRFDGASWLPENDYDFVVVLSGGPLAVRRWRKRTESELIPFLDSLVTLEVEVGVLAAWNLALRPATQLLYDLRRGHRCLGGDPSLLFRLPDWRPECLHPAEGLRLLVNRGCLLLIATSQLDTEIVSLQSRELVDRYLRKSRLAVGDAWLLRGGSHDHLLGERARRVAAARSGFDFPGGELWRDDHALAARQRLEGIVDPPGSSELRADLLQLAPRYGRALAAYARDPRLKRGPRTWTRRRRKERALALGLATALSESRALVDLQQAALRLLPRWKEVVR